MRMEHENMWDNQGHAASILQDVVLYVCSYKVVRCCIWYADELIRINAALQNILYIADFKPRKNITFLMHLECYHIN